MSTNSDDAISEAAIRTRIRIPLFQGKYTADIFSFKNLADHHEHIAIGLGDWSKVAVPLVRIHSECLTGDVFGSQKCDCGNQLSDGMKKIASHGGLLLYLRQEGRGIGLYNKIDAYELQAQGKNTFEANEILGFDYDLRQYKVAAQMLLCLGFNHVMLLSNNPDKERQLHEGGINVVKRVGTGVFQNQHNKAYLVAKAIHGKHDIDFNDGVHKPIKMEEMND